MGKRRNILMYLLKIYGEGSGHHIGGTGPRGAACPSEIDNFDNSYWYIAWLSFSVARLPIEIVIT